MLIKNIVTTNLFNFICIFFLIYFIIKNINLNTENSLHFIIIIILLYIYLYTSNENKKENISKSQYNKLFDNIDLTNKYLYSNYTIAYIFLSLLPFKKFNPTIFDNVVKDTNKLLKFSQICKKNFYFIQKKNILDMIYQIKNKILNNLASIFVNMPINSDFKPISDVQENIITEILKKNKKNISKIPDELLKRYILCLDIVFDNIIKEIKIIINKSWSNGEINIYSNRYELNDVPEPNPINLYDYNENFNIY